MAQADTAAQIFSMGDRALVVEFGRTLNNAFTLRARALCEYLLAHPLPCMTDVVPSYASVTVHFDAIAAVAHFRAVSPLEAMREVLQQAVERAPHAPRRRARTLDIPVCYGGEYGEDLDAVARHCKLTTDEVIRLHARALYEVSMLGFVPGFGYLGGLDRRLATPRRDTPRKRVPTGSVGIGGEQTAVYPMETPGGWNLIGRTPRKLLDFDRVDGPSEMAAGDHVRFVPIDAAEFVRLAGKRS